MGNDGGEKKGKTCSSRLACLSQFLLVLLALLFDDDVENFSFISRGRAAVVDVTRARSICRFIVVSLDRFFFFLSILFFFVVCCFVYSLSTERTKMND